MTSGHHLSCKKGDVQDDSSDIPAESRGVWQASIDSTASLAVEISEHSMKQIFKSI
jgi:hypothetical protein